MGKYSLIVLSGLALVFGWVRYNLTQVGQQFTDSFVWQYEATAARLTANSVARMSLVELGQNNSWRAGYTGLRIGDATGWGRLADRGSDTSLARGRVRITAWGACSGVTDTVVVTAVVPGIPVGVHGSITANASVTDLGTLTVDGRDHDLNGNVVPLAGTLGISTTQTVSQMGASAVGGTAGGVDYAPANPAAAAVLEENVTYSYPTTPDAVMGYADGTLKAMAQSGANGGQYVTDPTSLTFPLSGVTYVELPDGGIWQSMDFGTSTGVLVIHNAWGNAKIKDLNSGVFQGLLITDDIEKIHSTVMGAIVELTATPSGNCIGNGSGDVLYSTAALKQASSVAAGGDGGVTVLSWVE